jgi:hypothetical protein
MTIQTIKQHKQWLVPAAIVLTLAGVFVARTAFGKAALGAKDRSRQFPLGL